MELNRMIKKRLFIKGGFLKSFINSLKNTLFKIIYKQFRKTAYILNECLFILKGGELVDYEINSHIKCERTVIGFTVRRIP